MDEVLPMILAYGTIIGFAWTATVVIKDLIQHRNRYTRK